MTHTVADYTFLQNTTWRLKALYPFLRVKTIGKSVVGRSIYALEIGRENAPAVLFCGTFLGTDEISGGVLLQFTERLLWALQENQELSGVAPTAILQNRKIVVIPFVNPDGREICARGAHCGGVDSGRVRRLSSGCTENWDANARGVTLTGNFNWGFSARRIREKDKGVFGPVPWGYSGPFPESEPETVAISHYCQNHSLLYAVNFFKGCGRIYWRSQKETPTKVRQMAQVLSLCAGYEMEASMGKIMDTGFRNWFCKTIRQPALDVMINCKNKLQGGEGFYPELEELLTVACLL
jgi:g-D-glutamyl-meso-diaminopimelate peptidase